uniref:Uncharacterized protein n=1 Tax=Phasianus colchicus TaxID=9054 RepID=A0A669PCN5_PHACC
MVILQRFMETSRTAIYRFTFYSHMHCLDVYFLPCPIISCWYHLQKVNSAEDRLVQVVLCSAVGQGSAWRSGMDSAALLRYLLGFHSPSCFLDRRAGQDNRVPFETTMAFPVGRVRLWKLLRSVHEIS